MPNRRLVLWALAAAALTVGMWATADPRSFYVSFPLGRGWVAADGPYNEHLTRDFGALNLALCVLTATAAWHVRPDLVRLAATVTLVFALPHFLYHASHLEPYGAADRIANMATLSLHIVLPLWLTPAPAPTTPRRVTGRGGGVADRTGSTA